MVEYDEFNDIKNEQLGIFGASGTGQDSTLQAHDNVRHKVCEQGVNLEFECPGCGRSTQILVEWPELVAMKYGHNPADVFARYPQVVQTPMSWIFNPGEQAWAPEAKCPHCGFNFCIRMSPGEPESYLKQGRRANWINQVGERQVSQICTAAAQNPGGALQRQR